MELTINVTSNAGTVAWATEQLSNLEIQLRRDKAGNFPYLAYRAKWEEKPPAEGEALQQKWHKLAVPVMELGQAADTWDFSFFMRESKRQYIWITWPVKNEHRWGMFSYLTKAAYTLVDGFLQQVADKFQEYLDGDQEGEAAFKINVIKK